MPANLLEYSAVIRNTGQYRYQLFTETGGTEVKQESWVSLEVIAEHLGVSQDTVHRWIRSKSMPAHKVGRIWRFKVTQVDAWVEKKA